MESSNGETFALKKQDLASILALVGKAKQQAGLSPTGIIMLDDLKQTMQLLFDTMHRRDLDYAWVRMGMPMQIDDQYWEYVSIPKDGKHNKLQLFAQAINALQQTAGKKRLRISLQEETDTNFNFIVEVRDF